jgi:cytochrome P450
LDIVTCSSDARAYERLREEAESVFQTTKDWEDAPMLKRLVLMNSAIRESLRFHPPLINGLTREVVKPDGLRLPEGTLIPQGTWIGVPIYSVHTDGRFYPNGSVYDPFRFIEPYKAPVAPASEETSSKKGGQSKEQHAGQTSDRYLGWGYGRHAW